MMDDDDDDVDDDDLVNVVDLVQKCANVYLIVVL